MKDLLNSSPFERRSFTEILKTGDHPLQQVNRNPKNIVTIFNKQLLHKGANWGDKIKVLLKRMVEIDYLHAV